MNIKHGINYDCPCNDDTRPVRDLCDDCVQLLNHHDDNCSLCNPSIAKQEDDTHEPQKNDEMLSQINYPKPAKDRRKIINDYLKNNNKGNK